MKIPEASYAAVLELSTALVNASEAGDTATYWRLHRQLAAHCAAEDEAGRGHPFHWEALGDFTMDDEAAIVHYRRALAYAGEDACYLASIHLALAERHHSMHQPGQAAQHTRAAARAAELAGDPELQREIAEFRSSTGPTDA